MPPWAKALLWAAFALGAAGAFVAGLPWLVTPVLRLILAPRYGFRIVGSHHIPRRGPALLASNHVTWIDGFLLAAISPRPVKALVNASYIDLPVIRALARRAGLIPVPFKGPRAQRAAIEAVRAALDRGELVLIFPEAQLSRNGLLGPFYRGLEVILKDRESVPVVPIYLDNLWGSIFSHSGGRFFRKLPRGLRRTVIVAICPPVSPPVTAPRVRQAIQEASVAAATLRGELGIRTELETISLALPHWRHPSLGLLAASTADFDCDEIHQTGRKPGSVGQPPPGVALRAVGPGGEVLPPESRGSLEALLPGASEWQATGRTGTIDREGFVTLTGDEEPQATP